MKIERGELGFPYTPTLYCKRQQTRIVVEVVSALDLNRIEEWVAFGKSSGQDFRIAVCLPEDKPVSPQNEERLRSLGVGYFVVRQNQLVERIVAVDLALNVQLPELSRQPMDVRKLLGPAYEKFQGARWREGFKDACEAFEEEARRYLKRHTKMGRIQIVLRTGPVTLSLARINKMSMGQLAGMFARIQNQNRADSIIGETLDAINKDRIWAVHHKSKKATESRLRKNVGRHMWSLINAFKVVVK
ncbi:MAG: hypothetical protein KAT11_02615 [Phycisphaerae bacterium]|nr:hypothetical protein [Phycisphaerae bacterium]